MTGRIDTKTGYNPSEAGYAITWNEMGGSGVKRSPDSKVAGEEDKNVNGVEECRTCKERRYQDGSSDPGVSFKSPTKLNPAEAATAVYSHEREHYSREEAKAKEDGREVLSNNIKLFTDVCPECGKVYVSGGETTTVTRKKEESASFAKEFFDNTVGKHLPKELDVTA